MSMKCQWKYYSTLMNEYFTEKSGLCSKQFNYYTNSIGDKVLVVAKDGELVEIGIIDGKNSERRVPIDEKLDSVGKEFVDDCVEKLKGNSEKGGYLGYDGLSEEPGYLGYDCF